MPARPTLPDATSFHPTSIRFSLRTMMIGSVAIALMAAVPAIHYRHLPAEQARSVVWLWLGVFGGGLSCAIFVIGARYFMERRAGRKLYVFPWCGLYFPKLQRALLLPALLKQKSGVE